MLARARTKQFSRLPSYCGIPRIAVKPHARAAHSCAELLGLNYSPVVSLMNSVPKCRIIAGASAMVSHDGGRAASP